MDRLHERVTRLNHIKYRYPVALVKKKLEEMGKVAQSSIHVQGNYPFNLYPGGWEATVVVDERLYVFTSYRGDIKLTIEPVYGFYPNGLPRRSLDG